MLVTILIRISAKNVASRIPSILKIDFTEIHTTNDRVKCYCVSDLHADTEKNQEWVRENCVRKVEDIDVFTVMILPGDIGSEIDRLESVFSTLTASYDAVVYVPGNHEAWRRGIAAGGSATAPAERAENRMATDSVAKLLEVMEKAKEAGVFVGPVRIQIDKPDEVHLSEAIKSGYDVGLQKDSSSSTNLEAAETSVEALKQLTTKQGLVIFPLFSWYHSGWDTEAELTHPDVLDVEIAMPFTRKWGDFSMCSWPEEMISHSDFCSTSNDNTVLAEAFAAINEPFLSPPNIELLDESDQASDQQLSESVRINNTYEQIDKEGKTNVHQMRSPIIQKNDTVISFSHFLPRQELCPEKRFLLEPFLTRVIGSNFLESQIRRLKPDVHLFGHTHIPIDLELEGIRYVQWPKGYSRLKTTDLKIIVLNFMFSDI